jgi:hypothetical protein
VGFSPIVGGVFVSKQWVLAPEKRFDLFLLLFREFISLAKEQDKSFGST